MTDERTPGSPLPPDPDFAPQSPGAPQAPAPGWGAPPTPPPATPPPPPLAPYASPTGAAPAQPPPPQPAGAWTGPPPQQPAVAWAAPAAAAVPTKGKRTMLAGIAGILLLLGGIGGILLGLLVAVLGGAAVSALGPLPEIPELEGADAGAVISGVFVFFGMIVVAYSVAYLLAGIGVLRNSNWARVLGIVVGIISGLIWLSGLQGAGQITDPAQARDSLLFSAVALGIHVYIVVALLFFWRSKAPA